MLVHRLLKVAAALGGGLLVSVSFAPMGWWWGTVVGLAVLAWVLADDCTRAVGAVGYGLVFGLAFYVSLLPWTGAVVGTVAWLALSAVCALFPAVFAVAAVLTRDLPGWPLWWAAWWTAVEGLKSVFPFGGFPWGELAFGQSDGPLAAFARLGGAPLVSFTAALAGFCVAALTVLIRRAPDGHVMRHVVVGGLCLALITIGSAATWPLVRQSATAASPTITVALVQGNVPRLGLDFNAQRRAVLDNHVRQTLRLATEVASGRVPRPQVVIWPENSSDIDPILNEDARQQITLAAQAIGAPILVGAVLARPQWTPSAPVSSNTVIVWDPTTGPGQRHDKKIIQPFGEYLPWRSFFSHLSSYADRAGYFTPGVGSGVVQAAGVPIGVATCWEVIFDRAARDAVLGGAQVLAVPTNNATFNEQMSRQQLAFAKIRAIEHNRAVLVAGTTGISAVITPAGRTAADTGFFESAYLVSQIPLHVGLTPATRWAPHLQWSIIALAAGALVIAVMPAAVIGGLETAARPAQPTTVLSAGCGRHPDQHEPAGRPASPPSASGVADRGSR